jgi:hypothetical protein
MQVALFFSEAFLCRVERTLRYVPISVLLIRPCRHVQITAFFAAGLGSFAVTVGIPTKDLHRNNHTVDNTPGDLSILHRQGWEVYRLERMSLREGT